ncbi:MAG TPA: dephospho-CoA kinase [Clostridiaceae bacterium]|nr:dephospho-CoA kinase [Clostridiaceae bacterium]
MGLTGGIASGKSSVSSILRKLGAFVIDADLVSREIIEPESEAWEEIVKYFGYGILKEDGTIDRKALGDIVFSAEEKLLLLNDITHPKIIRRIEEMIRAEGGNNKTIIIDAALLIELGMQDMVDEVWVVHVDKKTQIERLLRREEITKEQALDRIYSQISNEEKIKYADKVIDNNGTFNETIQQVIQLWEGLKH